MEPEMLEIVTRVDDGRERIGRQDAIEPAQELCAARAAGQSEDAHAAQMELPADGAEPLRSFHG